MRPIRRGQGWRPTPNGAAGRSSGTLPAASLSAPRRMPVSSRLVKGMMSTRARCPSARRGWKAISSTISGIARGCDCRIGVLKPVALLRIVECAPDALLQKLLLFGKSHAFHHGGEDKPCGDILWDGLRLACRSSRAGAGWARKTIMPRGCGRPAEQDGSQISEYLLVPAAIGGHGLRVLARGSSCAG